jgi:hypothetical protein
MLKKIGLYVALAALVCTVPNSRGESSVKPDTEYGPAPVEIQAALFIKLFLFNNDLNSGGELVLHVIGAPEFAAEVGKSIGKRIGKSTFTAVTESAGLPEKKPSVVYLGRSEAFEEVVRYTHQEQILSITGIPELVRKGVTLGVGTRKQKPKILFNPAASEKEGMDWNPVIVKIAEIVNP